MKRWDLLSLPPSTEKERPREPGADAPRVPRRERQIPRVLFSAPECRAVAIELESGETMGNHHVRERAVVQVIGGRVAIEVSGETTECAAGTLVTFAPGEEHSVHALEDATLLLILAPWPAAKHYTDSDSGRAQELPPNASVAPISSPSEHA
ncbi:MAG TPA: cupin domain-containing protein [Gaiellaceae bacterium]|nr:cupin domain-containing protein [Gaiellaceae bacterium]